jgi:hypothetical protein
MCGRRRRLRSARLAAVSAVTCQGGLVRLASQAGGTMTVATRPRMNGDRAFLRAKLDSVMEPHVRPLNVLVARWNDKRPAGPI